MDPRIGMLNGGRFYAYVNGHGQEPFIGTLAEVEAALGLRGNTVPFTPVASVAAPMDKLWNVTMRFEFPAWDERDGYVYRDIPAATKSEANQKARRMAELDGHAIGGRGRYYFTAEEA